MWIVGIMTKKQINAAIAHTGLRVEGKAGDGCYYFVDIKTDSAVFDAQSIYIGRMRDFRKSQWIEEAEEAAKIRDEQSYMECDLPNVIVLR